MRTLVRLLLLRWFAARTLGGVLGTTLAAALPLAAVLKLVGLPVLLVGGVVATPVALALAAIGLPVLLVLAAVGVVAAVAVGAALLALAVLKYVVPLLLVGWAVSRLVRTLRRRTAEADARWAAATAPVEDPLDGAAPAAATL